MHAPGRFSPGSIYLSPISKVNPSRYRIAEYIEAAHIGKPNTRQKEDTNISASKTHEPGSTCPEASG